MDGTEGLPQGTGEAPKRKPGCVRWDYIVQSALVGALFLTGSVAGGRGSSAPNPDMAMVRWALFALGAGLLLAAAAEWWVCRKPGPPQWTEGGKDCRMWRFRPVIIPGAVFVGLAVTLFACFLLRLPAVLCVLLLLLVPGYLGVRAALDAVVLKGRILEWRDWWGPGRRALDLGALTRMELRTRAGKHGELRYLHLYTPQGEAKFWLDCLRYPDELQEAIIAIARLQESKTTKALFRGEVTEWLPAGGEPTKL